MLIWEHYIPALKKIKIELLPECLIVKWIIFLETNHQKKIIIKKQKVRFTFKYSFYFMIKLLFINKLL